MDCKLVRPLRVGQMKGEQSPMTATCEACWATFEDENELAKHVEMENAVDWPIDGLKIADGGPPGCPKPFRPAPRQRRPGGGRG